MGVPATTGVLRTRVQDMEIGDYIICGYDYGGSVGSTYSASFSELGKGVGTEIPVLGSATPNGSFYFVKVAKGLLLCDRVIHHTVAWDNLNTNKFIQGKQWDAGNIIPTMTSNTSPSGVASASSETSSSYQAWKAFNKTNASSTDCWASDNPDAWLQYKFDSKKVITAYAVTSRNYTTRSDLKTWTFEGSNDGQDWHVLDRQINVPAWASNEKRKYVFVNKTEYLYYRINVKESYNVGSSGTFISLGELEMMETAGLVRSLTGGVAYADIQLSDVTDQSKIITSGAYSGRDKAFDNDYSSGYASQYQSLNATPACWVGQDFGTSPKIIVAYSITAIPDHADGAPTAWTFEGSNDNVDWEVLDTRVSTGWSPREKRFFEFTNATAYRYYRINITANKLGSYTSLAELEFAESREKLATMSLTNKECGAFPTNNEWDKYIVNFPADKIQAGKTLDDVFHVNTLPCTWVQDTPVIALGASTNRVIRGNPVRYFGFLLSSTSSSSYGFRPVFEYKE